MPPSTSFPRECDEPISSGRPDFGRSRLKRDLQLYSCGTVLDLHQLRRVLIVIYLLVYFTTECRAMVFIKPLK